MKKSSSHQSFLTRFKYRAKPIRKHIDLLTPGSAPINKKINATMSYSYDKLSSAKMLGLQQLAPIALENKEMSLSFDKTPSPAHKLQPIAPQYLTPISLGEKSRQAYFGSKGGSIAQKSKAKATRNRLQGNVSISLTKHQHNDSIRKNTNIYKTKSSIGNPIGDLQNPVDFSKMRSNQTFDYRDNKNRQSLQPIFTGDVSSPASSYNLPPILFSKTPANNSTLQVPNLEDESIINRRKSYNNLFNAPNISSKTKFRRCGNTLTKVAT